jgi:hypothetical protein
MKQPYFGNDKTPQKDGEAQDDLVSFGMTLSLSLSPEAGGQPNYK